jgi:hypothetical protein
VYSSYGGGEGSQFLVSKIIYVLGYADHTGFSVVWCDINDLLAYMGMFWAKEINFYMLKDLVKVFIQITAS